MGSHVDQAGLCDYVAEDGLELLTCLVPPPKYQDSQFMSQCPMSMVLGIEPRVVNGGSDSMVLKC